MSDAVNYKDTLNLPQTDFPMKGNLSQTEPVTIAEWKSKGIYQKIFARNKNKPKFVMPDGPPYANGNIHLGHVLNKALKDIVIKYKNMSGFQASFTPGWDCHGLPIELKVTKELGDKKKDLSNKQIRDLCRKEAQKWVGIQGEQFKRLGVIADWDHPYLTMNPIYEAEEVRVLARIFDNGIFFRGEKPVYWCPALQTALAAAEVEYRDHKSISVYVKFYIKKNLEKLGSPKKPVAVVIWTTTPWTLPANYGVSFHPEFSYGLYDTGSELLIVAEQLKEAFEKESGLTLTLTQKFKGTHFDRMVAEHPFMNRDSLFMLGEHVTLDAGTGAVHTAPGHGMDDYHVGLKYGLPVHSPVDPGGKYTADVPEFQGISIWKANPLIVEKLKNSGHLVSQSELVHSYPHNPRSKTPLIFRATPQWFIKMDDEKYPLRKKALAAAEKEIQFVPQWGYQRLHSMLTNSPDWCLSRQRIWGVPIPVFYCKKCTEPLVDSAVMNRVADQMEKSGLGIEAYFDTDPKEFTQGKKCGKCAHTEFESGKDILDVWFDSGVGHTAIAKLYPSVSFPADIYLEGSDQHRGWFQTSLLSAIAATGKPPFKSLITHGFVNDAQGHKMSKSQGNVIDPATVIDKNGAEILRLWVAYEDYGQDVTVGNEMFLRITETYRRIRNTFRFLLGNLSDFDPQKDAVAFDKMPPLDQWALLRLNQLVEKSTENYNNYDFYKVYHALNNFFTVDLSAIYLDILKDRLYTWKKNGLERRASQTVLFHLLDSLTKLMAPILSFLSEETYKYIPGHKEESVFLTDFPKVNPLWKKDGLLDKFDIVLEVRAEVSKALESLRKDKVIGANLDAEATVTATGPRFEVLKEFDKHLKEVFILSNLVVKQGPENKVEAQKASGDKCPRCWHYNTNLQTSTQFAGVCPKCVEALS